jgi:ABC-type multidrug transport system ATPase subunit
MKRRLTLAMGLVNSPNLLFLDEPTSGLDVQSNLIIREVISDLILDGVTVFLTTHNIERQMSFVIGWLSSIKEILLQSMHQNL